MAELDLKFIMDMPIIGVSGSSGPAPSQKGGSIVKMFRRDEGFTLVELMVVVLIIGILIAIAIPVFNAARANAQTRSCQANLRTIDGAIQQWVADGVGRTEASVTWAALVPNYIKAQPTCPGSTPAGVYTITTGSAVCANGHTYP